MRQHENSRAFLLAGSIDPMLAERVRQILKSELKDTRLIKPMYEMFCEENNPGTDPMDKLVFISSILNMYCPSALFHNLRVTGNVCSVLTAILGYNNRQSISELVSQTRSYIKGPRFREKVENLSTDFLANVGGLRVKAVASEIHSQYSLGI